MIVSVNGPTVDQKSIQRCNRRRISQCEWKLEFKDPKAHCVHQEKLMCDTGHRHILVKVLNLKLKELCGKGRKIKKDTPRLALGFVETLNVWEQWNSIFERMKMWTRTLCPVKLALRHENNRHSSVNANELGSLPWKMKLVKFSQPG